MNMTKIAKLAGCSLSTVSKAFRNSSEISEATKEKIFSIAKENNCFTKFYSPALKKRIFAVICNEFSGSVYSDMVETLHKKILDNGDMLLVSCNKFISSALDEILEYYINFRNVDGLILIDTPAKFNDEVLKRIPTVGINSLYSDKVYNCDFVNTDSSCGIYSAISYFKKMGHTKIAFIGEYLTVQKLDEFKDAMKRCKLEINEDWLITSSKRKSEAGVDALDKLLSLSSRPTAVFAAYDAIAFGAMSLAYEKGLKIPDDISIIGFDNIPLSQYSTPSLTTVSTPIEELSDITLDLLYKRLKYTQSPYKCVSVQSDLIIRRSVKKLN